MNNNDNKKDCLLPPPELLERYDRIQPGLSKSLINIVLKEQEHRHSLQNKYLFHFRLGQVFGILFLIFVFYEIFELIKFDKIIPAYLMFGGFCVIIMVVLFQFKKSKSDDDNKNLKRNNYNNNVKKSFNGKRFFRKKF